MRQQQTFRGFIFILLMLILIATAVRFPYARQADKVTNQDFIKILEDGQAADVSIHQNPQTPTGEVVLTLLDGQVKRLYVSDVKDAQKLLEAHDMAYTTMDVPQENYLVTIILPFMLSIVVVVIIIMVMNRSAGGGGANARMMNFGKSRARMSRDSKVNFSNVAGLVEEKEELEEVVDFLKNPQKYTSVGARIPKGLLLVGPPGTGKTTLAKVIAHTTSAEFLQINATSAGKKDMEEVVKGAKDNMGMYGRKTILFVDEIHRFNKGQQDYLLPFVEDGTILLIGATTENPYFEVNGALISRSRIFELKPLENADIRELLERALHDKEKGMGSYRAEATDEALDFLADMAGGDARAALNAIELGILTTERSEDGLIHITLDVAQECIQRRAVKYDKTGDNHYDTISAFIKSMRGTDPDAAVYYLAKMLDAGEDIKFIARRIMICASEDVGNADPQAIQVAVSAALAVERIGLPEARIILSQAATYVASAPKSNAAYVAVDEAQEAVRLKGNFTVPSHLRDCHYSGAEKLGHGDGYKYAHDYPNHYVKQQYLPDGLEGSTFYRPSENGYEKKIGEWLHFLRGSE